MDTVIERWRAVRQCIEKLQQEPQVATGPVTLIAVAKGQPVDAIRLLIDAGQRDFAENRVQEAAGKWPEPLERNPDIRLHLIGSLQTNKVKEALSLFNVIHTVDREALVDAIVKESCKLQVAGCRKFFIQVNTGEEPQKGGVTPDELPKLMKYWQRATGNVQLAVAGLMCVPPVGVPPAPHFALLYKMAQEFGLPHLSMGMSGDYETAIRLGATHVRIGTALFGERK